MQGIAVRLMRLRKVAHACMHGSIWHNAMQLVWHTTVQLVCLQLRRAGLSAG